MNRAGTPTLEDVARAVGVNRVTVSVALGMRASNGGTRVSSATRDRIQRAAHELGYVPNANARAIRSGRCATIGLYFSFKFDLADPFTSQIIEGLLSACHDDNHDLLVFGQAAAPSPEHFLRTVGNGKIDGLILVSEQDDVVFHSAAKRLPIVSIANAIPGLPSVVVDDEAGGQLQAALLAQHGHREIGHLSMERFGDSPLARRNAFNAHARALGLRVTHAQLDYDFAPRADVQAWLDRANPERPTAIACANDYLARVMMYHARVAGLRIPDELSVIGFNGRRDEPPEVLPLTTIRAPWSQVAGAAYAVLRECITGSDPPALTTFPVSACAGATLRSI
jgi:DNA-binding LacI/PurR family transcriptional regulator